MNEKQRSLAILQSCLDQLDNMSDDEIARRLCETGLDKYVSDNISEYFIVTTEMIPRGNIEFSYENSILPTYENFCLAA